MGKGSSRIQKHLTGKPVSLAQAGGAFVWNYNSQWAFGANLMYWFVPQLYFDSSFAVTDSSRLGNFLEFTLTAVYHF